MANNNISSILASLPNNGNLVHIVKDGRGIIKDPVKYDLKHAKVPLNYMFVQRVENRLTSLRDYQKMYQNDLKRRNESAVLARRKRKLARLI